MANKNLNKAKEAKKDEFYKLRRPACKQFLHLFRL